MKQKTLTMHIQMENEKDANLGPHRNGKLSVENAEEARNANVEDDGKVSKLEATVDTYPGNADETKKSNGEDDENV